jgi:hypothetical protein
VFLQTPRHDIPLLRPVPVPVPVNRLRSPSLPRIRSVFSMRFPLSLFERFCAFATHDSRAPYNSGDKLLPAWGPLNCPALPRTYGKAEPSTFPAIAKPQWFGITERLILYSYDRNRCSSYHTHIPQNNLSQLNGAEELILSANGKLFTPWDLDIHGLKDVSESSHLTPLAALGM